MTRRRRGRRSPARTLALAAALVFFVLFAASGPGGRVVLVFGAIAAAAVAGSVWLAARPGRPVHRSPAPPVEPGAGGRRPAAADPRARRNGWAPPARPRLVTVSVSPECAGDACALCPGGDCACPCRHDSRVIAAMNTARADTARPPF